MSNKRMKILKTFARMKGLDYKDLKLVDKFSEPTKKNKEQYRQIRKEVLNYRRLKKKESEQ